jgi:hypothetical protein
MARLAAGSDGNLGGSNVCISHQQFPDTFLPMIEDPV